MVKVWGPGERRGTGRWRRAVVARHRERRLTRAAPPGRRASGRGAGLLFCAALGFLEGAAALLGGAVVLLALDARTDQLGVDVVLGVRKLRLLPAEMEGEAVERTGRFGAWPPCAFVESARFQ